MTRSLLFVFGASLLCQPTTAQTPKGIPYKQNEQADRSAPNWRVTVFCEKRKIKRSQRLSEWGSKSLKVWGWHEGLETARSTRLSGKAYMGSKATRSDIGLQLLCVPYSSMEEGNDERLGVNFGGLTLNYDRNIKEA